MIKKVLGLAALLVLALAPAALAQDYPPAGVAVTVNDTTPGPGQTVTIAATGFQVGTTVTFDLFSAPVRLGTAVADTGFTATLTAAIPASTPAGTHTIQASGTGRNGQPATASVTITVGGTSGTVPVTGANSSKPMAEIGVGALALGGLLVLVARRRRKAVATVAA